jgi:hypothetical protein
MEYIISRNFRLPTNKREFANGFNYNLWARKNWPYNQFQAGDILSRRSQRPMQSARRLAMPVNASEAALAKFVYMPARPSTIERSVVIDGHG